MSLSAAAYNPGMGEAAKSRIPTAQEIIPPHAQRNFLVISARSTLFRLGWLFKNEGIVVSSFLKLLGANNFILSVFALTNRLCRALPQPFIQGAVRRFPTKKYVNWAALTVFGLCWAGAGSLIITAYGRVSPGLLMFLFYLLYLTAMLALSLSNLTMPLLSGKLIPAHWRGRMQAVSVGISVPVGILLAFAFIRPVLATSGGSVLPYGLFFINVGAGFIAAGLMILLLKEYRDQTESGQVSTLLRIRVSWRSDRNFRRLLLVRGLLYISAGCLTFYTSHGIEAVRAAGHDWGAFTAYTLIALETGKIAGSVLMGNMADRFGNRAALLTGSALYCIAPVSAVVLGALVRSGTLDPHFYIVCYVLAGTYLACVGLSNNYMIEVAPGRRRPIYIAASNMSMLASAGAMPLLGLLGDFTGLTPVFLLLSCAGVVLGYLILGMEEPRFSETCPTDPTGA